MTRLLRHSGSIYPTETAEAAARPTWGQGNDQVASSWLGPVARGQVSGGACAAAGRYGVGGGAVSVQRTEGAA
jgi:hypothetical protein